MVFFVSFFFFFFFSFWQFLISTPSTTATHTYTHCNLLYSTTPCENIYLKNLHLGLIHHKTYTKHKTLGLFTTNVARWSARNRPNRLLRPLQTFIQLLPAVSAIFLCAANPKPTVSTTLIHHQPDPWLFDSFSLSPSLHRVWSDTLKPSTLGIIIFPTNQPINQKTNQTNFFFVWSMTLNGPSGYFFFFYTIC